MLRHGPAAAGLLLSVLFAFGSAHPASAQDARRGEYLAKAGGCLGCHTAKNDKAIPYAGGRALVSPFGTFYGPNITPHPTAGIGRWSEADFLRAMREGRRPDGTHYFPAFPYTSFTRIVDADLKDLWAFLRMLPPNATPSREHELRFPFRYRFLLAPWKWLFFEQGPMPAGDRGAYLAEALGHCGECHTPRNFLGGLKKSRHMAGARLPDGAAATNITPTRLKKLGDKDLEDFLRFGQWPDGDVVGETMGEVIRNTTSQLSSLDLQALMAYLRALPPLPDEPKKK